LNTLNEALGLITAGNLIQQDAETTANALKVMSLRIRGSKTDLEEMGEETDGLASSTSKLREEIKALTGVDIMKDEDTYKSTAEIIKEIGAVWDNLTDVSKASALEKLAGKTRASTVAGLLENYETIDEVIKSAEDADGSATEENLRYMESIEGKIAKFINELQEFWHGLIDSKTVKGFIDFGTKALDIIGKITSKLGTLGTVAAALGIGFGVHKIKKKSGGRVKKFALIAKYATESFSREVCEIKLNVHWYANI
jgi:TP901 family phage tail tape measure protein